MAIDEISIWKLEKIILFSLNTLVYLKSFILFLFDYSWALTSDTSNLVKIEAVLLLITLFLQIQTFGTWNIS